MATWLDSRSEGSRDTNNPTSKSLITSALRQLASIESKTPIDPSAQQSPSSTVLVPRPSADNNLAKLTLASASQAKSALLTLHFLFPFDFLPALDLIDRHLIQKLYYQDPQRPGTRLEVFYVQSASAVTTTTRSRGGRFGNRNYAATRVHYEVRLDSWNCSCPAFAAASLKLILGTLNHADLSASALPAQRDLADTSSCAKESSDFDQALLGGVATKGDATVPVCKHILAAALCDAAPRLFEAGIQIKEVSVHEMAAWAAGWGEA